jgi:hypothetical protein
MEDTLLVPVARKREKVRSAWISFAGRIAAQLIGAAATVGLGVVVFGTHRAASDTPPAPAAVHEASAPSVLIAKPVWTKEGTVLVFVPLDRYEEVTDQMVADVASKISASPSQIDTGAAGNQPVRWAAAKAH